VECSEYHTETLLVTSRKYLKGEHYCEYASAAVTAAVTATVTAAAAKGRRVALSVCAARERQRLVRRRVCQPYLQAQRSAAQHGYVRARLATEARGVSACVRACMRARGARRRRMSR
jgi:hypothetical protein